MTYSAYSERYSHLINLLLFAFPILIISIKVGGDLILFLLLVIGVYISISWKISPFKIQELRILNFLFLFYFFSVVASILFSGKVYELSHYLSRELYFVFTPFIALAIYKSEINPAQLILGIKAGILVLGAMFLFQFDGNFGKFLGGLGPNSAAYGNILTVMVFMSILRIYEESFTQQCLSFFCLIVGVFLIILSGSRGSWIGVIVLVPILLRVFYLKGYLKAHYSAMLIFIAVCVLTSYLTISNFHDSRLQLALNQTIEWYYNDNLDTPIGQRFEMWNAGIKRITEGVQFTGLGYRNVNNEVSQFANPSVRGIIANYNHLHNIYINKYLAEGVPGLFALLFLLLMPLIKFYQKINNSDENIYVGAIMGLMLTSSFIIFGMTNGLFGDVFINAFYVFFLTVSMKLINQKSRNNNLHY